MRCFEGDLAQRVFLKMQKEIRKEIENLPDDRFTNTEQSAWIDYFVSKYEIDPFEIDAESLEYSLAERDIQVRSAWHSVFPYESEYICVSGLSISCRVPFSGESDLLKLTPNPHTLDIYEIDQVVEGGNGEAAHLVLSEEMCQSDASADAIQKRFSERVLSIKKEVSRNNEEAVRFNKALPSLVEEAVRKRAEQLDRLHSLKKELKIPLKADKTTTPIPMKKRKLVIPAPRPSEDKSPSYAIEDEDYENILDLIERQCSTFELTPNSYSALGEEQLRDIVLAMLNTHYEQMATGETFRKSGKTDISIPFEGHAAFISECKIWHGKIALKEAINQLFGYSTWRDVKVSLIIFNRNNKNFPTLLASIDSVLNDCGYKVMRRSENSWRFYALNQGNEQLMQVTLQVFDLYFQ